MAPRDPSMPHLTAFVAKMQAAGLSPVVVETFAHYYTLIYNGETGLIGDRDIVPVDPGEIQAIDALADYTAEGATALARAVMVDRDDGWKAWQTGEIEVGQGRGAHMRVVDRQRARLPVRVQALRGEAARPLTQRPSTSISPFSICSPSNTEI